MSMNSYSASELEKIRTLETFDLSDIVSLERGDEFKIENLESLPKVVNGLGCSDHTLVFSKDMDWEQEFGDEDSCLFYDYVDGRLGYYTIGCLIKAYYKYLGQWEPWFRVLAVITENDTQWTFHNLYGESMNRGVELIFQSLVDSNRLTIGGQKPRVSLLSSLKVSIENLFVNGGDRLVISLNEPKDVYEVSSNGERVTEICPWCENSFLLGTAPDRDFAVLEDNRVAWYRTTNYESGLYEIGTTICRNCQEEVLVRASIIRSTSVNGGHFWLDKTEFTDLFSPYWLQIVFATYGLGNIPYEELDAVHGKYKSLRDRMGEYYWFSREANVSLDFIRLLYCSIEEYKERNILGQLWIGDVPASTFIVHQETAKLANLWFLAAAFQEADIWDLFLTTDPYKNIPAWEREKWMPFYEKLHPSASQFFSVISRPEWRKNKLPRFVEFFRNQFTLLLEDWLLSNESSNRKSLLLLQRDHVSTKEFIEWMLKPETTIEAGVEIVRKFKEKRIK